MIKWWQIPLVPVGIAWFVIKIVGLIIWVIIEGIVILGLSALGFDTKELVTHWDRLSDWMGS